MEFRGRVVWITGASSGIGRALARALHEEGARLILSSRDEARLEEVAASCGEGSDVAVLPLDLARVEGLPEKAREAEALLAPVDILVHNAAVAQRALAAETELAVDRVIMETNFFGPIALTKAVLPGMLARGRGQLVVVGSLSGVYGIPRLSAYAASKHALTGYFDSLRAEVHRHGVRVTVIVPGLVRTEIGRRALTGSGKPVGRELAVQERGISPERCAARMVRAIRKDRELAFVGGWELASVYLNRWFPGLLRRLIRNHPVARARRLLGGADGGGEAGGSGSGGGEGGSGSGGAGGAADPS